MIQTAESYPVIFKTWTPDQQNQTSTGNLLEEKS